MTRLSVSLSLLFLITLLFGLSLLLAFNVNVSTGGELVWECHTNTSICVFLRPGVSDSYKKGWSHTLDTLWGTQAHDQNGDPFPGQPGTNSQTRQVFDEYLDYAILAGTIGDLQFDVLGGSINPVIPPEFGWLASTRQVAWTDIHGVYHVRFSNLRAPDVAGLYIFKIPGMHQGNYPITIVKDELNPAWIEVTVRTQNLLGAFVPGIVTAIGTTPEGRPVTGKAYWGPNDFVGASTVPGEEGNLYRTYLFGLPAGTYEIRAEAPGFSAATSEPFALDAGQSYLIGLVVFRPPSLSQTMTVVLTTTSLTTRTISALLAPPSCQGAISDIHGTVYWYDMYGNLRRFPWALVTATSVGGGITATSSTTDGTYALCVPPGTYNVIASSDPGFVPQSKIVTFSPGGIVAGVDFQLQPSGEPIPEYPGPLVPVLLVITILATAIISRRNHARRLLEPVSMRRRNGRMKSRTLNLLVG